MASSKEESDLRVVLLGKNSSELSRVGNFILNRAVFDAEPPPSVEQQSERARGTVEGRYITLINTPHLFDTQLSQKLIQRLEQCVSLCAPGPHLIALVLQPDNFTKADRYRLNHILSSLSAEACKYTLVLTTKNLSGPGVVPEENVSQKVIAEWGHRHVEFNSETSPSAIVEMMGKMVEENGGDYLKVEMFEKSTWKKNSTPLKEEMNIKEKLSQRLNLVVCGSNSELKSSISHHILGQRESSPESSSECVRKEGELCGRLISLVELPALYNTELSEEDMMRKALHCVSCCDPGVHAFLLIVPEGPLTDEDRGEMEKIQRVFGSNFKNHTMAVIAKEPQQETGNLDDGSKRIIETFSGYVSASDDDFSLKLLDQVEKILEQNNRSFYTTAEYLEAHVKALLKYKSDNEELQNTINFLQKKKNQTQGGGDVRIVLLGKTGVGKSAAGNTILGKEVFQELLGTQSVTSVCQRESAEVGQRRVTVIDTPGLFDTSVSNEEIRKEIVKCITMAAPGPHVFLLIVSVGRFTEEEQKAVKIIQDLFGDEARRYTMVLFTRGDDLRKITIEDYIKNSDRYFKNFIEQCGNRYHVFNNRKPEDRTQVTALLEKITSMVAENEGKCYTNEMFQLVEEALQKEQERILKEKEQDTEREKKDLRIKHDAEVEMMKIFMEEERKNLEKQMREKEEEFLKREAQIRTESNNELKKEMNEKLKEQRDILSKEMKRKEQIYENQMQKKTEQLKEKYETDKENIRKQAEDEARRQAEEEFCDRLEEEVTRAREEGYEEGKSDFENDQTYAAWLAHHLSIRKVPVVGAVGGAVGGLIGGIVDSFIFFKNKCKAYKTK